MAKPVPLVERIAMEFPSCEPDVREVVAGWLATTPKDHPYRIGVLGTDEAQARRRFVDALEGWKELHNRVEAERSSLSS